MGQRGEGGSSKPAGGVSARSLDLAPRDSSSVEMFGKQCGICCCTLSVFGILVLVTMGMMVSAGDPNVGGHHLVATAEDRAKRASACYTAAGIYCGTLALSAVCYFRPQKEEVDEDE